MAQPTAQDLCTDALQNLQIYGPGDIISDADMERMFSLLNDLFDVWSNLTLSCYTILENSFPLVPGQQSYTIGPGGNINTTRPLKLIDGPGAAYVQDFNGNNYGVNVVPRDTWNLFGNRTILVQSNFPDTLFYDPQFPLGIINVMPVPTIAYTMFFDSYQQLSELASLTTTLSLPPGYKRAVVTNLAVSAKPYFLTAQLDPLIMLEAKETLGNIKRTNMRPNVALMEPELVSRANVGYNVYTDRPGSGTG